MNNAHNTIWISRAMKHNTYMIHAGVFISCDAIVITTPNTFLYSVHPQTYARAYSEPAGTSLFLPPFLSQPAGTTHSVVQNLCHLRSTRLFATALGGLTPIQIHICMVAHKLFHAEERKAAPFPFAIALRENCSSTTRELDRGPSKLKPAVFRSTRLSPNWRGWHRH